MFLLSEDSFESKVGWESVALHLHAIYTVRGSVFSYKGILLEQLCKTITWISKP